jgi:2-phosphosulfolactate phosphatase
LKVHVTTSTHDASQFRTIVLVDVLRSSSAIITALSNGATAVIPFTNVLKAVRARQKMGRDSILAGERNGITPRHFDHNISPFEMSHENVSSKTVLYSSSNLTRILGKLRSGHSIIIGGTMNANAVGNFLQTRDEDVAIFPCGTKLGTAIEDLVGAGAIAASMAHVDYSDDALAAIGLSRTKGWRELVRRGRVARKLIGLGYGRDVAFCLRLNSSPLVPGLGGDRIVALGRSGKSR